MNNIETMMAGRPMIWDTATNRIHFDIKPETIAKDQRLVICRNLRGEIEMKLEECN
ncbi:hypothetical protein [Azotosporobacter soli]|uniref:hypothetical protein n=1 Tax=Azotosporobacter soli TaxID=3055040 RepID=UPI0031FE8223